MAFVCFCLSRFVFEANLFSCRCRHFILQHFHTAVEFQLVSRSFGQEGRQCRILLARNVSDFVGMPYPVLGTIAKFGNRIAVILAERKFTAHTTIKRLRMLWLAVEEMRAA